MADDLAKNNAVDYDDADPEALEQRQYDEPGSFLDLYRSMSPRHLAQDEFFVDECVLSGVVPKSMRYSILNKSGFQAYRGVVQATDDSLHYFQWNTSTEDFRMVKADTPEKEQEATDLYRGMAYGCDLADEDETEAEKANRIAAMAAVPEENFAQQQERLATEHHPGAAGGNTPDDPNVGRQWHATKGVQGGVMGLNDSGLAPLQSTEQHWNLTQLVKACGEQLEEMAPRVLPAASPLEARYMRECLGATEEQIAKGVALPPRHRIHFEQWKADQLVGTVNPLEKWLNRK